VTRTHERVARPYLGRVPRPPRPQFPHAVYHLGVHAGWSEALFRRDSDRDIYFWLLDSVVEILGWDCIAYCLLTTHLHLLVQTPLPNLSAGMQRLNSQYAQGFNRRYGRHGHVVESRFWHGSSRTTASSWRRRGTSP
jgi:putative transposase